MVKAVLSAVLVLAIISSTIAKYIPKTGKRIPQTLSRGWGDQLIWAQTYEEALYWSRSRNKPLMVIFHLEDCPHSQALKKVFSENNEIQKTLDEDFIVLNLMVGCTLHLSRARLSTDPSMTVRADINGRYSNRMYAYETGDISLLISNMQTAKKLLKAEL
uniref:Anterior gradient 2 n=1 Tax=Poecilia reticulata TaxID=8081 RepID=A0A3P9P8V7_POERE